MTFNPDAHLMDLQGKSYLEVKWRLVWFRQDCPDGTIDTEEVAVDLDREVEAEVPTGNWIPNPNKPGKKMPEKAVKKARGYARFRAVVTDGKGGRATATKCENAASFPDFIEKAETGSVGRALAMLGYGTQFTGDELSEEHRIVDAPVEQVLKSVSNGHQPAQQGQQTAPIAQNGHTPIREEKPPVAPVKAATAIAVVVPTPAPPSTTPSPPEPPNALQEQTAAAFLAAGLGPYERDAYVFWALEHPAANPASWTERDCKRLDEKLAQWMDRPDNGKDELGHTAWTTRLTADEAMRAEMEQLNTAYKDRYDAIQGASGLAQYLRDQWGYDRKTTFSKIPRAVIDQMLATMRAAVAKGPFHPDAFQVPAAYQGLVRANRDTVVVP